MMLHKPLILLLRSRAIVCLCAALCSVALSGCSEWGVSRRITVKTNPPGAQVYIDNYEIGTTPCSTFFTYYGTRDIRIVKDGYETLSVKQPFPTPWYEYFPIDFVAENFWPRTHDERVVEYNLVPQQMASPSLLLSRAEQMRRQTQPRPPLLIPQPGSGMPGAPLVPGQPTPLFSGQPTPAYPGGIPPATGAPTFTPSNASPNGAQWPSNGFK